MYGSEKVKRIVAETGLETEGFSHRLNRIRNVGR